MTRPEILEQFLNPMYDPNPLVIWPSVAPQSLVREREREILPRNVAVYIAFKEIHFT